MNYFKENAAKRDCRKCIHCEQGYFLNNGWKLCSKRSNYVKILMILGKHNYANKCKFYEENNK